MPKQKTRKGTAKRFKITKRGKILRRRQYGRHLRAAKSGAQKRRYKEPATVAPGFAKMIKRLLGYA